MAHAGKISEEESVKADEESNKGEADEQGKSKVSAIDVEHIYDGSLNNNERTRRARKLKTYRDYLESLEAKSQNASILWGALTGILQACC